jgi:hypothetical protein
MKIKEIRTIIYEELESILKEEIENKNIEDQLKDQLSKMGIDKSNPVDFKLIDKRNKSSKPKLMSLDNKGEIVSKGELDEGLKDTIMAGIVCTIMASGMVSCTKPDTDGFGYNVSSRATEYVLGKGTPNKDITISTPKGDEQHKVDSNFAKKKDFGGSQGSKFKRPMTPTEGLILRIGHAVQSEKNMNNKQGTSPSQRWDYNPDDSYISGGGNYYIDEPASFQTPREHPLWKIGIEYAEAHGKDVQSLIQKADKEVQEQDWIKD